MAKSYDEVRAANAERAWRSRERRKNAKPGWWRNGCQECGNGRFVLWIASPFYAEHRKHATEENTVLLIDGVPQEPRFRADGEIVIPRFPPKGEDGYYRC